MNTLQKMISFHVKEAAKVIDYDWELAGKHMKIVHNLLLINLLHKEIKGKIRHER